MVPIASLSTSMAESSPTESGVRERRPSLDRDGPVRPHDFGGTRSAQVRRHDQAVRRGCPLQDATPGLGGLGLVLAQAGVMIGFDHLQWGVDQVTDEYCSI